MKKLILTIIISVMVVCFCGCSSAVKIDADNAVAKFEYADKNIEIGFSAEDFEVISTMFDGKEMHKDSPSCSFTEDVSIIIDDCHFCIANDTCGVIYVKEKDKYFNLTDEENKTLRDMLEGYGFTFPCV